MAFLTASEVAAQPNDEHRAVWAWLDEHRQSYPDGAYVPPMRAGKESRRVPVWAGLECVVGPDTSSELGALAGVIVSVGGDYAIIDDAGQDDGAARIAAKLFTHKRRGTAYVVADGGRLGLHLLFRRCWRAWIADGYSVHPNVSGTYIKSLTIQKAKHAWHLVDLAAFTGLSDLDAESILAAFAGPAFLDASEAVRVAVAAGVFAGMVQELFGVAARLTAARTAVAAAARNLSSDEWLWRPSVLAVTLARVGGGFRGGYSHYPAYRGPGHKIDIRRAYTWALAQPLPLRSAIGPCVSDGVERPGMYVCDLTGPGYVPAYVAPFNGSAEGFKRRMWSGDRCVCVLTQSEFSGLRAIGYTVTPGWGLATFQTFCFAGMVQQIERLTDLYGTESPQGLVAKALGVSVYGKLAESPEGEHITFAVDRPSDEHLPFLDAVGDEVPDAWSTTGASYKAHQHVDVAAEITALVRCRVYQAIAQLDAAGIPPVAVDTDGLVCNGDPHGAIQLDSGRVGGWRYCGYDPDVIINGPRFAAWRGRAITAGTSRQGVDVVAIAHDRGSVTVEGKVMAPAWQPGPMSSTVTRTLRAVSS